MNQQGEIASQTRLEEFHRKHRVAMMTMLFTDIVGSTKLKLDLGDVRAVETIEKHHEIVRSLLAQVPDAEEISTAGDSFFIVFVRPSDAVQFALRLQGALRNYSREIAWPISDRIGIHVGEVFIQDHAERGSEFFGIQIDTSARIMALGGRDQILLSRFAYDSARHTLRRQKVAGVGEIAWVNHGFYELKDVEDPVEVCEVGEIGLAMLAAPKHTNVGTGNTATFTTKDGKRYRNVTPIVTDSGLNVVTPDGGVLIPFNQLPDDLSVFPPKVRDEITNAKMVQVFKVVKPQRAILPAGPVLTRFETAVLENYTKQQIEDREAANIDVDYFVPAFTDELPGPRSSTDLNVLKTIQFINQNIKDRDRILYYDAKIRTFVCGLVGFCPNGRVRISYHECRSFNPADLDPNQIEKITSDEYEISIGVYTIDHAEAITRHDQNGNSKTHTFVLPVEDDAAARVLCKAIINFIRLYRRK